AVSCAEGLPEEVVILQKKGMVFYKSSAGNLLYNPPGKGRAGAQLVFPDLRSGGKSGRATAGLSNYSRNSNWYKDLRFLWEERELARRVSAPGVIPEVWQMYDIEMKIWLPENMIDMGHIKASVEHNQDMLRFAKRPERVTC
ncbi:MAG: hypothetical protein MJA29_04430, partial [Candidatus Omnitrophica bacterium]|nr:hypothetical protein [Candidatus Omnitrophota bacterium]